MADLTALHFNAAEVEPSKGFEPLPAGDYLAMIVESEVKTTAAGTGTYLKLVWEVLDGQYKGRKLFDNITITNPSGEAVTIGKANLSAICRAVGVMTPKDSAEMHQRPASLHVGFEKRRDSGEMQNRIKKWSAVGGASSAPAPVAAAPAAAPWAK